MFTSVYERLQNPVQGVRTRFICSTHICARLNNSLFASKAIGLLAISFVKRSLIIVRRTHTHMHAYASRQTLPS